MLQSRMARRIALRKYQEMLDRKTSAWKLDNDPRLLPDMNTTMQMALFDRKPEVREDVVLSPGEYGHSDYIPEEVKKPKQ